MPVTFDLFAASTNSGKLRDFASAVPDGFALRPLPNIARIVAPVEDQPTFEGNAMLKAIFYSRHATGKLIIADDSGLEVDALAGAPGVRSARFADDAGYPAPPEASPDERNNLCLLAALSRCPKETRQGRYRCVLAAARDGMILATAEGEVEGAILSAPRGTGGFGYDPLFFLPAFGLAMAEIDIDQRLACSHRANALRALLPKLIEAR